MPEQAMIAAHHLHAAARLCLVVGSSLVVYPAARLPGGDPRRGRQARDREPDRDASRRAGGTRRGVSAAGVLLAAVQVC